MSASPPRADVLRAGIKVCLVPEADMEDERTILKDWNEFQGAGLASLPAALQHQTDLATPVLQDIDVGFVPKLEEAERIVFALLGNGCRVVAAAKLRVTVPSVRIRKS